MNEPELITKLVLQLIAPLLRVNVGPFNVNVVVLMVPKLDIVPPLYVNPALAVRVNPAKFNVVSDVCVYNPFTHPNALSNVVVPPDGIVNVYMLLPLPLIVLVVPYIFACSQPYAVVTFAPVANIKLLTFTITAVDTLVVPTIPVLPVQSILLNQLLVDIVAALAPV